MTRLVRSLCSMPAYGALGSPTFMGGVSGLTTITVDEIDFDTLGDRADATPGGTLADTDELAADWGFSSGIAVWFDGYAALHGLSLHADHKDFSISFWYNPYDEAFSDLLGDQAYGAVFSNCGVNERLVNGSWITENFQFRYTSNNVSQTSANICGGVMPGTHNGDPGAPQSVSFGSNNLTFTTFSTDPVDEMQGWCHVMGACHTVGGRKKVTVYVNDTAIISDAQMNDSAFYGGGAHIDDEEFTMRFSAPTFTDPNGDYGDAGAASAPWAVGGRFDGSNLGEGTLMTDGSGMVGAVTEMWIAPGQYIDWSSGANREKFHKADLTGTLYAPVNLGSRGQAPTGTRPQYYFTGPPSKFPINRGVGGAAVSCWHRSAPFGLVDVLRDYTSLPGT